MKKNTSCSLLMKIVGRFLFLAAFFGVMNFSRLPLAEGAFGFAAILMSVDFLKNQEWKVPGVFLFIPTFVLLSACSMFFHFSAVALKEWLQTAFFLLFIPLVLLSCREKKCGILRDWFVKGFLFACLISVVVAVIQTVYGNDPLEVKAFVANRLQYGVYCAIAFPLLVSRVKIRFPGFGRLLTICTFSLAAFATIYHFFALLIFALSTVLTLLIFLEKKNRFCVWILIAVPAVFGFMKAGVMDSVSIRDDDGFSRRWVIELQAAAHAVNDAPWLGHGPGNYQKTVSSATYRRFLPPTVENRVEEGNQSGLVLTAVENGLPALFVLLAGLCITAMQGAASVLVNRNKDRLDYAPLVACFVLICGMLFCNFLTLGSGVIFGLVSAFAMQVSRSEKQTSLLFAVTSAGIVASAVVVCFLFISGGGKKEFTWNGAIVPVECETSESGIFRLGKMSGASGGKALQTPDRDKNQLFSGGGAGFDVQIPERGDYRLAARVFWRDGCGNSVRVKVGDEQECMLGNDGSYRYWHWVEGPVFFLEQGVCRLEVRPSEAGACVDQLLLFSSEDVNPSGIAVSNENGDVIFQSKEEKTEWNQITSYSVFAGEKKERFRAGVGGAYRGGPESFFTRMGIPCTRVMEMELMDFERIKEFDLLYLSGPAVKMDRKKFYRSMHKYVSEGGTLIIEKPPSTYRIKEGVEMLGYVGYGGIKWAMLGADDSLFFEGIRGKHKIHTDIYCELFRTRKEEDAFEEFGKIANWKRKGPALVKRKLGKGEVYFACFPVGFTSMWRSRELDRFGINLLREAIGSRYTPLFDSCRPVELPVPRNEAFNDDFMRLAEEAGNWKQTSGKFELTGPTPSDGVPAFASFLHEETIVQVDKVFHRPVRIAASFQEIKGSAVGLWIGTEQSMSIRMVLADESVLLKAGERILDKKTVRRTSAEWVRMSLCCREGKWEGWVNGRLAVSGPATWEPNGMVGIFCENGSVFADDVAVRSVSEMIPATDRIPGEEGSALSSTLKYQGHEPQTIYSAGWYLKPDVFGRNAVKFHVPIFDDVILFADGSPLGTVEPSSKLLIPVEKKNGRVPLPVSAGIHDYTFATQVFDWYSTGKRWSRLSRWSCSPEWAWLGVKTSKPSIFWYGHELESPYSLIVYAAPSSENRYGKETGRDLNLVIGGNGKDLTDGLQIKVGRSYTEGVTVWNGGKKIAEEKSFGLPTGHALHHRWFELKAVVNYRILEVFYEGRSVLTCQLPEEYANGFAGFWTQNNSVRIARATVSEDSE